MSSSEGSGLLGIWEPATEAYLNGCHLIYQLFIRRHHGWRPSHTMITYAGWNRQARETYSRLVWNRGMARDSFGHRFDVIDQNDAHWERWLELPENLAQVPYSEFFPEALKIPSAGSQVYGSDR